MPTTKLKVAIQQSGIKTYVLAAASRVHPSTLSRYQRGHRIPRPEHLARLAEVLECDIEDLMGVVE